MNYTFLVPFIILLMAIIICDKKYAMLRDSTKLTIHKPYSWSRVQMAWWTLIILSSFVAILWQNSVAPVFDESVLILLGISAGTIATARVIDISDDTAEGIFRHQDSIGKNFFLDILCDESGVSIHRFQTLLFNLVFGCWFIIEVNAGLNKCFSKECANEIMPIILPNNLILLALSSAMYVLLKSTENRILKDASSNNDLPDTVPDESISSTIAQG